RVGERVGAAPRRLAADRVPARFPRRAARRRAAVSRGRRRRRARGAEDRASAPGRAGRVRGGGMTQAARRLTAGERRQAVLDNACRVFSRSSYRGATTAEIAREAGISEPILYRHFGSKRDLYLACLDEAWLSFRDVCEEAMAADPERCLGAISDAYMAKGKKIRVIDLWIQALNEASSDKVIAAAVRRQIREVRDFFADVIRDG